MPLSPPSVAHSLFDDIQALLVAPLFMALGVVFLRKAGLLTGGMAGLAFLFHYLSGWRFGLLFFLVNLPFYIFAVRAMGWAFTFKTFVAVGLLSLYSEFIPDLLDVGTVNTAFAAVMGGLLSGISLLILIRHRSSLGGVGVLAIYLQDRYGLSAGRFQMAVDSCIVLASFFVVDPLRVGLSVLGAVVLNMVIAINHKPGRYMGI